MKKNQNFRIAIYIRVSTDEQTLNPEGSLRSQELSLREDFDTTTAAGEMLLFQIMNFAQFERKQCSERVTANILSRASRGLHNGGPVPLGYKLIANKHGYLDIDKEQAATIKVIFDSFLREGSLTSTARWLNENGYQAKKLMECGGGKKRLGHFYIDNLHTILRNKAYMGIKSYKLRGEVKEVPAMWEAIVDPVTFIRVGVLLSKNKNKLKPQNENSRHCYMPSGISFCKNCGDSCQVRRLLDALLGYFITSMAGPRREMQDFLKNYLVVNRKES